MTQKQVSHDTQYIYICGAGHSGSTLLSLVLGSHSQVVSLGEITHFTQYVREDRDCTCGVPVSECEFWQPVLNELSINRPVPTAFSTLPQVPPSPLGRRWVQLLGALGSLELIRISDLVLGCWGQSIQSLAANDYAMFDAVRKVSGRQAIVDSSKYYLRMKLLYMHCPLHFKAIHLVRDGRGVMASNIRKKTDGELAVRRWIKANRATILMMKTMSRESHIRVRYEKFCERPEAELERICSFLGLDYQAQALAFRQVVHHDLGGNRMRFGTEGTIVNQETWRTTLSQRDLDTFERTGGRLNRRLGYD